MKELEILLVEKLKATYINPYTDFGFKKLFGVEVSKDLLMDFLNQLLPERHVIYDCLFENSENTMAIKDERRAIFDIRCTSKSGETFVIEMQKAKLAHFEDRALYYTAFPIQQQAKIGTWNFKLAPVYLVALLDFDYDTEKVRREIVRKVSLIDQNGELFSDNLHFIFIQMTYFKKTENELETRLDKWLYFLKNLENFQEIPNILNEPIFQKAFKIARVANMNIQEYKEYSSSLMNYLELNAAISTAKDEGIERGIEQTIQIIKYFNQGLTLEEIALKTGKTMDFVNKTLEDAGFKI